MNDDYVEYKDGFCYTPRYRHLRDIWTFYSKGLTLTETEKVARESKAKEYLDLMVEELKNPTMPGVSDE